MKTNITETLYQYIRKNQMIREGERICAGLSGGADSVCLTQLLFELSGRLRIRVCAFHVNHCLRGAESDADEAFVKSFCEEREIPLKIFRRQVGKMAKTEKCGLEEAGRLARKGAAQECLDSGFADKIALAHHMDDQAETVLFNLARGASLPGLRGMLPVNGPLIRPLLFASRAEIEETLVQRGIHWRTDSTNLETYYTRNRIRRRILPEMEEMVNKKCTAHIAAAARDLAEADEILGKLADAEYDRLVQRCGSSFLVSSEIRSIPYLLAGYVLRHVLEKLSGSLVDITRGTTGDTLQLLKLQAGRKKSLPYGITAVRTYEGIRLFREKESAVFDKNEETKLEIGHNICFNEMTFYPEWETGPVPPDKIPKKTYTKWFDYDKISACSFRTRRAGDYLVIDREGHTMKLKDYFINEKVPKDLRDRIVCLAEGSRVAWVVGMRISEDCRVTDQSKRVVRIRAAKGTEV